MLLRDELCDRPTGRFICRAYRAGKLIDFIDDANLVVNESKTVQSKLLGGSSGYAITQMGWGTNGTTPQPPDTALTSPYYNAFASVTYPSANQVQFNFALGVNEAIGVSLSEFGLVTASGLLFARKVRSAPLLKAADITLSGSWIISF